jgi:hypothetical protein
MGRRLRLVCCYWLPDVRAVGEPGRSHHGSIREPTLSTPRCERRPEHRVRYGTASARCPRCGGRNYGVRIRLWNPRIAVPEYHCWFLADETQSRPRESGRSRWSTNTTGYNFVEYFDTTGCRKSPRDYSRQYNKYPDAAVHGRWHYVPDAETGVRTSPAGRRPLRGCPRWRRRDGLCHRCESVSPASGRK